MTRKKAKKELMAIGFDRNAAELWIKQMKRRGIRENRWAVTLGILRLRAFFELVANDEGCKKEELELRALYANGKQIFARFRRKNHEGA